MRRRIESGGLIYVVYVSTVRRRNGNVKRAITFIDQQYPPLAVMCHERQRVDIGIARCRWARGFNFDLLVAGPELIVKQLEHPETCIRLPVTPIHHRNTGELRGEADKLRLARNIDSDLRELSEKVSVHCSRQMPVGIRNRLDDVCG